VTRAGRVHQLSAAYETSPSGCGTSIIIRARRALCHLQMPRSLISPSSTSTTRKSQARATRPAPAFLLPRWLPVSPQFARLHRAASSPNVPMNAPPSRTRRSVALRCSIIPAANRPGRRTLRVCAVFYAALTAISKTYARRLVDPADLADPDSRFLDVDSVVVHCKRYTGAAGAPKVHHHPTETIVALHGFGSWSFSFETVLPQLLAMRPATTVAWAYDSPGFGLTSRPSLWRLAQYRSAFARRVVGTLTAREAPEDHDAPQPVVVLIGHSLGACGVVEAAVDVHCLRALVLVAPALPVGETVRSPCGFLTRVSRALHTFCLYALVALSVVLNPILVIVLRILVGSVSFWARGLALARFGAVPQSDVDGYRKPLAVRRWDTGILHFSRAAVLERALTSSSNVAPIVDIVKRVPRVPILIIHGGSDNIIPLANSRALHAQLPGSRFVVMPNVGHIPHEGLCSTFFDAVMVLRLFSAPTNLVCCS
jgi:pimeloyl-ACP methyl ester carboxylesterase